MSDTKPLFDSLRNSADPNVVAAIEAAIRDGSDRKLCRINVLNFAAEHGLDEEKAISGFLHAARLGLFELSWNVLCPGCGGVLDAHRLSSPYTRRPTTARSVHAATNRRSTRWSRSPLRLARACAGSRRTIRIRSRSGNISGKYSGARGLTCLRSDWKKLSRKSRSSRSNFRRREGADIAAIAGRIRDRVRAGHPRGTLHRR